MSQRALRLRMVALEGKRGQTHFGKRGQTHFGKRGQTHFQENRALLSALSFMPRRPRFVLPDVPHHVTQRGNNRQDVFFSDQDRFHYLEFLRESCLRYELRVLAWCLMTNHVHLIVIPATRRSLALGLGQAHSQYALELNRMRKRVGHLWQNRFFSCPLEPSHLMAAMAYVELNPVRAAMAEQAWDWPWSSALAHVSESPLGELLDWPWRAWMEEARLGAWDPAGWKASLASDHAAGQADLVRRATRLGEPLGSEDFVKRLERKAGRRLRVFPKGRPPGAHAAAAGEQLSFFGR